MVVPSAERFRKIAGLPVFCFRGVGVRRQQETSRNLYSWHHVVEYRSFQQLSAESIHPRLIHSGRFDAAKHCNVRDEKGAWRELPINAAFWDIACNVYTGIGKGYGLLYRMYIPTNQTYRYFMR